MEHVVFFPAHDGSPAFRRVASLEDAVRLVEHLRNSENVSEVSVHSLTEVPLAFKPYYKVEVPTGPEAAAPPAAAPAPAVAPVAAAAAPAQAAPAPAAPPAEAPVEAPAVEVPAVEVPAVEVPQQSEAPAEPAREPGAASLGFFAS